MLKKLFLGNTEIDFYNIGGILLKVFVIEVVVFISVIGLIGVSTNIKESALTYYVFTLNVNSPLFHS